MGMSATAPDRESKHPDVPMPCIECGTPLPIRAGTGRGSVSLVCRFCGARYRGVVFAAASDDLLRNIKVLSEADA